MNEEGLPDPGRRAVVIWYTPEDDSYSVEPINGMSWAEVHGLTRRVANTLDEVYINSSLADDAD